MIIHSNWGNQFPGSYLNPVFPGEEAYTLSQILPEFMGPGILRNLHRPAKQPKFNIIAVLTQN